MKCSTAFIIMLALYCDCKAQVNTDEVTKRYHQRISLQGGLSLLENPFVLYPVLNVSYSRALLGRKSHQLAVLPQLGAILLPGIETKFLVSTALQYVYSSKKRVEASAFLGINYQLRWLAYDRYQFENNALINKGNLLHQFGPTAGLTVGYKVVKQRNFSISPFLGLTLTRLTNSYRPDLFAGYKPISTFGITFSR